MSSEITRPHLRTYADTWEAKATRRGRSKKAIALSRIYRSLELLHERIDRLEERIDEQKADYKRATREDAARDGST